MDDLILVGNNLTEIQAIKSLLDNKFKIKDLGNHKFFLGMEVARSKASIALYQRKYTLDLLQDTLLLAANPLSTHMDYTLKLSITNGEPFLDVTAYRRLIVRLLYLT